MIRLQALCCAATVVGNALFASAAFAVQLYHVTDLGTASTFGQNSWAVAINNQGQVLGSSNGVPKLYTNGRMTNIGSLGGSQTVANGLNDNGQVVGYSNLPGNAKYHAFSWQNGNITDLGVLSGNYSWADDVNNSGQIVGVTNAPGINQAAFLYANGQMSSIGSLGGVYSWARGISKSGLITGLSSASGTGPVYPFLYSNGSMTNLGVLSDYDQGIGYDVNDNGQVVGYLEKADANKSSQAFYYSNGTMSDLGTFGGLHSEAFALNASGVAVGYADNGNQNPRAFVYRNGTMFDLNTLLDSSGASWLLQQASDINDQGWIVGYGSITGGGKHAFLLTPVPEPSSIVLLFTAGLVLTSLRSSTHLRNMAGRRRVDRAASLRPRHVS